MDSLDCLNVREAALRLGVHENTIRNWVNSGVLRAHRLPGSGFRRIPLGEIERMEATSREGGPVEPVHLTD